MATATHPTPSFDITAADDMDLHSDDGALGYNDGDIELDLEPPPSHGPDDDVSIDDAASTSGMDAQAGPSGDNDDYMVDQEDVIEEDYNYEDQDVDVDVDVDVVAEQSATVDMSAIQAEADVQDEDLLDYSEEDDDYHDTALRSPWLQQHNSMQDDPDQTQDASIPQQESFETQGASTQHEDSPQNADASIQQDEIPADLQALMSMTASKDSHSPHAQLDSVTGGNLQVENHENSLHPQATVSAEEEVQTDADDGGVTLKNQEENVNAETRDNDTAPPNHDHDESAQDSEHQAEAPSQLPPVTVNWMGEELWLFKEHDYEKSGDWLLEDISVARTSMSDLFQACRSALGHEVMNGMEIGFRFDHFRNMELFEESTASVAVSLERLVNYYHVLHEQDGNNEPDSFYMTLLYRPRFATLLADIARYADNGRGYSGLEAAIAACETNFHSASLNFPADETTEWDTEGQEHEDEEQEQQEQEHGKEQEQEHVVDEEHDCERDEVEQRAEEEASKETYEEDTNEQRNVEDQVTQETETQAPIENHPYAEDQLNQYEQTYEEGQPQQDSNTEQHHEDDARDSQEEGGVEVHESEEAAVENASTEGHEEDHEEEYAQQPPNSGELSANAQEVADYPEQTRAKSDDQTAAELEARRLQEEGDIIDYSDGEDEPEAEEAPRPELSLSPATVGGDESTNAERQSPVAESPSVVTQTNGDDDQTSFDTVEDPNADADAEQPSEELHDEWDQEYEEFLQATEEGYGSFSEEEVENGDAEVHFPEGEEFYGGESTTVDGDYFTNTNDAVDVDNAQWAADQELAQDVAETTATAHEDDNVDAQDEEDGVAGQSASATSWAADPTTASSTDAHEVSPQGHKRSIDEAGHGVDIAPDSIDAKRARV